MGDWQSRVLRALKATKRKTPIVKDIHLNFIFFHYVYIIGLTILGSIVLYPGGGLSYTDALVFASGTSTQSGLNPVDVNKLKTYQQFWIWFGSMVANPIVIHTSVVFVRLHWFEKRFEHIVREAKSSRRSRSRASMLADEQGGGEGRDPSRAEMGIRGSRIEVVRDDTGQAQGHFLDPKRNNLQETSSSSTSSSAPAMQEGEISNNGGDDEDAAATASATGTMGASDPERSETPEASRPENPHIAVLEKQRRQTGPLRIPGPREYAMGAGPQSVDDTEGSELRRKWTTRSDHSRERRAGAALGRHITIDEPEALRSGRQSTFPQTGSRQRTAEAGTKDRNEFGRAQRTQSRRSTIGSFFSHLTQPQEIMPYLSWQPTMGRNSAFVGLTEEQRNELGGIEYRSLKTLAIILISYFIGFHLIGIVCLVPWIMETPTYGDIVRQYGQGRPWWGIFSTGSAFNDQGFTLTPDSMVSFNDAIFPVLLMTYLIIIGNTAFPCMLRFIIWVMWKLVPRRSVLWEELHFLLDHPRRCFSLLFPRSATWLLFGVVVILNVIDLILFIILDLNNPTITHLPAGIRFIDGLFGAAATRTAGLSVVPTGDLHPAVQVSYMIMMYISVYPIAISLRKTNVYEERSLGIYSNPEEDESEEPQDPQAPSYLGSHLRKQLGYDLWYVFLGLFLIAIIEGTRLRADTDHQFSMFAVLFETVSAYGTVGLSLGYPSVSVSLSGEFKNLSKLVIIAMEIRGRHRGLPNAIDRAILLPSEALHQKEAADAEKRAGRRGSTITGISTVDGRTPSVQLRHDTGISTSREQQQQQQEGYRARSETGGSGGAATTSSQRPAHANNVTRLPTHEEQE